MTRNRPSLPPWSPRRLTMALEPRHLFDGAAPVEVAAAVQDDGAAAVRDAPAPAPAPVEAPPRELIVVDSRLVHGIDVEKLLAGPAKVVVLDPRSEGLAQIAAALDGEQNLAAIHILSHGSREGLLLGLGLVNQSELQRQGALLASIGSALSADGDILLYGCDVAADNRAFIDTLAGLTQADVAASSDATGSAALGGNWVLEMTAGPIEARALALADFEHLLAPPSIVDGGGARTTSEDTPLAVTGISIADADAGDMQTVTLVVSGGTITLHAGSGASIAGDGSANLVFSGTLTQVNTALDGMSFAPTADYFGAASIAVYTDDSGDGSGSVGPTTVTLTVTPVDDLPAGRADTIAVTEDATAAVMGNVLANDINVDAPIDTLGVIALRTGTVAAGSGTAGSVGNPLLGSYGSLTVGADGAYSYSLNNTLATVQALAAGDTLTENFTYTLSDGHSTAQADITVTVSGNNDAPRIVGTPAILVASSIPENATNGENPGTLVSALLSNVDGHRVVSDVDAGTVLGIAIYDSNVSNGMTGVWEYSLDGGGSWTSAAPFSPTAALLLPAAARLRFVADSNADDGKESGVARISYYAWDRSDGASAGATASVGASERGGAQPFSTAGLAADFIVTARNDIPTLVPVALELNEGSTRTITITELPVVDQDNGVDQLTYRVEPPLAGKGLLLRNGIALSVGSIFTQKDVQEGRISYRHTGSELFADDSDSVTLTLRDGAGGQIPVVLPIAIRDVNAQIAITGTTQTVAERVGSEASDFTVLNLGLSDADGVPDDMTLTITSLPAAAVGRLQYWNGSIYVDVFAGLELTGTQLANRLHFISSGAEPAAVSGSDFAGPYQPTASFTVVASDNKAPTPSSAAATVTLTVVARNDPPTPVTQLLTAPQGGPAVAITPQFLTSSDPDSAAANRVYTVNSFPRAGLLELNGEVIGVGSTFTEDDLSSGRLTYTHDGRATDGLPSIADDSFDFSVNDRDGGVSTGTLEIDVSPTAPTGPGTGGTLRGITAEGLFTSIDNVTLTGSDIYTLSAVPTYGTLYLDGAALAAGSGSFSQAQLDDGRVVYVNNGAEPAGYGTPYRDAFTVTRSGGAVAGSSTIALIVTPVNDAPTIAQGSSNGGSVMEASAVGGLDDRNLTGVTNAVKLTSTNLQHVDPDTDPAALAYVLESAPLGGDLRHWSGAAWVVIAQGGTFAASEVAAGNVAYFHSADSELRSDSIVVHLRDGGVVQVGDVAYSPIRELGFVTVNDGLNSLAINKGAVARSPSRTVSFTITNVNDAPLAYARNFVVDEGYDTNRDGHDDNLGRIQVLNANILAASDSDDDLATATYTIVSLPQRGVLEIDRGAGAGFVPVIAGEQFDYLLLSGGKLRYVQDGSDTVLTDSFTWQLNDPAGLFSNVATVSIDILPKNDPPVVFNNTGATVPEGGVSHITYSMLGSEFPVDTDTDNTSRQAQFRLTAAVQNGTLYLDKPGVITALGVGAAFTLEDIQNGYLKYRHNGSETPLTDHFDFTISDGSGDNEPSARFNITILPVNDAPQLSALNPLTYFEDDGATLIDPAVNFNDVDLANGASYNAGTTLTIAYTLGSGTIGDQLSLRNQGAGANQVGFNAGSGEVSYAGTVIATVNPADSATNGANGAQLVITFNASANVAAVKAVLENLTFQNTDLANASQLTAQATRSLRYTFVDGGGAASRQDDAGTTLQGVDTVVVDTSIIVKQRNDAPVMNPGDTVLAPISEDETSNGRSLRVSTLLGGSSDVDNGFLQGIAISGLSSGNGSWQVSLDSSNGSDGAWTAIGSVSPNSSLLLDPNAWVRFIPDGRNATTASFTYRAWDQTTGSVGGRANSSLTGGTTAFSMEDNVVSLTVTAVNDAPVLADTTLTMSEREDAGPPLGAVGTPVSSLLGGISDVDSGDPKGLAIIGANASAGSWHFSTDGGANWLPLGDPSPTSAVLLAPDARLYFQPNTDYNGVQASALSVRAWDQSSDSNGASGVDTTAGSATTRAFSTATDSVALTVTALNDAPTITNGTPVITAVGAANENTPIALGSIFTLGDADLARAEGSNLGQINIAVPHGAFVLNTTGVTLTAGSQATDRGAGDWGGGSSTLTFTGTLAQLQAALNTVQYVPGDDPDASETISVSFDDLNNAGAGAAGGGSDVHSVSAGVRIDGITAVNDAPTISTPATVTAIEDVAFSFANSVSIADPDARNADVEVVLSIPTGSLTLTPGATVSTGLGTGTLTLRGTVSQINSALATLSYTSAPDANNLNVSDVVPRTLTITVSDLGNSPGNPATAATASASTLINLTPVNDTPTLDVDPAAGVQATRAVTTTVNENATTVIDGIVLADPRDSNDGGYGSNTFVVITALHGTLAVDGSPAGVTAFTSGSPGGRSITLTGSIAAINAAIAAGDLNYTPDSNFSGNDTLSLLFDDAGNSGVTGSDPTTAAATIPLLVSGVNDAPLFSGLGGSVGFTEDGTPVVLDLLGDGLASLTDPELAGYDNWGGAVLTLQRTGETGNPGAASDDVFGLTGSGNVGVNFNGNEVRIGAGVVGSFTRINGVLSIAFGEATTTAQVNTVLQALTYSNGNDNPPTQVTIGYTIDDGNTDSGTHPQGTGGPRSGSASVSVGITANNDAPVLTAAGSPLTASFFEDDGVFVSALPPATISDPELSAFGGGNGDWGGAILSVNRAGGANGDDLFGVSGGVNLVGDRLRIGTLEVGSFTNAGGVFAVTFDPGTTSVQVQAVADGLTYSNSRQSLGNSQDEIIELVWTVNDGNAALAGAQGEGGPKQGSLLSNGNGSSITLRGRNDAPVLDPATVRAISVAEDDPLPLGGAVGAAVADLAGGVSDVDMNPLRGVAIIATDNTLGTWLYTVDGGTSWIPIGAVGDDQALLLRDSDRVYFQPNPDSNGTVAAGLTLRAWDRTAGNPGDKVNTSGSNNGGSTPFSTASDSVALTVGAQNDAPTRLLANVALPASLEDAASPSQATIANLFNAAFSDAKDNQGAFTGGSLANGLAGIVITGNAAASSEGKWQYLADGNPAWTDIPTTLTAAGGLFLPATYTLRFQPAADWNGSPGSLTVRLVDDSAGVLPAAGSSVNVANDTALSGGTTRYSDSANAVSLGTSIASVNDAPAGADRTITAIEDTAYSFQAADFTFIDAHDSPPDSFAAVLISTLPGSGILRLSGIEVTEGQSIAAADIANLTWTPPLDANGPAVASFTFQVVDDGGRVNGGMDTDPTANTITFAVSAVADITDDSVSTHSAVALRFNPLSGTNGATADNFENPAAAITAIGSPAHGNAVLNGDGTITYTATPGYVGADSFTYTVSSGGVTETATISVTVTNAVPVANPDTASTLEDTPVSGNVLANDTDGDAGDTLTVTRFVVDGVTVGVPAGASGGSTLIAGVGNVTVRADGSYTFTPLDNWHGSVPTLTYTLTDTAGATASSTLAINVGDVNDPPLANDDAYDTTDTAGPPGGTPINGNVLVNDTDPDAGTTLQVVAVNGGAGSVGGDTSGSFGTLTLAADGRFSYAVERSDASVQALLRGQSLTDTFSYTISDGDGATSTATLTFTIHGTNDAPSAGNDSNTLGEEQSTASGNVISGARTNGSGVSSIDLAARDIDPDGDPLTVVGIMRPGGSAGSIDLPLAGSFGAITIAADGSYSYALDNANVAVQRLHEGETLSESFVYTTSDGRGALVDATITITITGSNDQPLAVADVNRIAEDATLTATGNVLDNDSDVDSNSALSVVAVSGSAPGTVNGRTSGSYGTLTLNGDGSYSYRIDNGNGAVQALGVGQTLTDTFSYTVSDGEGGTATTTLTITIDGRNEAPVAVADTASTAEDSELSGNVLANDNDPDGSHSLLAVTQFAVNGLVVAVPPGAVGGSLVIAGVGTLTLTADGDYRFTPLADWNGRVPTVTYTIRDGDGAGATASSTLDITVTPVADFRVPPYVLQDNDVAPWLEVDRVDRIIRRIEQSFAPAHYVLQQVNRAQASLAEGVAALLGVYDARETGDLRSLLRDLDQTLTPGQFVLKQGVAFSRQLLAELAQRARANSRLALGGESLYDDLSIFSPLGIAANSGGVQADAATTAMPAPAFEAPGGAEVSEGIDGIDGMDERARDGGGNPIAVDALLPPVPAATRPTPGAAARSFSEQLRQSQSERRRLPLA